MPDNNGRCRGCGDWLGPGHSCPNPIDRFRADGATEAQATALAEHHEPLTKEHGFSWRVEGDLVLVTQRGRDYVVHLDGIIEPSTDRLKKALADIATAGRDVITNRATKSPDAFVRYAVDMAEDVLGV